jgi:hypothetical protein
VEDRDFAVEISSFDGAKNADIALTAGFEYDSNVPNFKAI